MIGSLKGRIIFIHHDYILLEVANGVGYTVHLPQRHIANLSLNDAIFLFIHTQVREDAITLYGFTNEAEQSLFLLLTSVQGVGSKMGLNIISTFTPDKLRDILLSQDMGSITLVNGIGKRLGERIITELKNKVVELERILVDYNEEELPTPATSTDEVTRDPTAKTKKAKPLPTANLLKDATSALENLGYSKADAMRAAASAKAEGAETLGDIITNSLRLLG
jgi:holliday junction DNA helicase RuvA